MSRVVRSAGLLLLLGAFGCELGAEERTFGDLQQDIANGDAGAVDVTTGLLVMGARINGQLQQIGTCSLTVVTNDPNVRSSLAVATARHCVRIEESGGPLPQGTELQAEDLLVFFEQQPGVQDTPLLVEEIEYHANADLAMLKLTAPAPASATLVNGQSLENLVGQNVRIAGYGITSLNGGDAGRRRGGTSTLLSVAPVSQALENAPAALINGVAEAGEVLFIGNEENGPEGSNLCPGDSGGSTFMDIGGERVLVGVNSQIIAPQVNGQPDCADASLVGVSVRVDRYAGFVNNFITRTGSVPNGGTTGNPGIIGGCSSSGTGSGGILAIILLFLSTLPRRRQACS